MYRSGDLDRGLNTQHGVFVSRDEVQASPSLFYSIIHNIRSAWAMIPSSPCPATHAKISQPSLPTTPASDETPSLSEGHYHSTRITLSRLAYGGITLNRRRREI